MKLPGPFGRTMIFGGGAVGTMFARLLTSVGAETITIVDRQKVNQPDFEVIQADVRRLPGRLSEIVAISDLVILALPEEVTIETVGALVPLMRGHSLLVDTLSVKSRYGSALSNIVTDAELLGINPRFAPGLGFAG